MSDKPDAVIGEVNEDRAGSCPVVHGGRVHPTGGDANNEWWPNRLNLKILAVNSAERDPYDADFDYVEAFNNLDLAAVKADVAADGVAAPAADVAALQKVVASAKERGIDLKVVVMDKSPAIDTPVPSNVDRYSRGATSPARSAWTGRCGAGRNPPALISAPINPSEAMVSSASRSGLSCRIAVYTPSFIGTSPRSRSSS